MVGDRFAAIDALFRRALEVEPAERTRFVRTAAGGDDALADEVIALLGEDDRAGALDGAPPLGRNALGATEGAALLAAWSAADPTTPVEPPTIAGYRLLRPLGAGGMGVVYEAQQESPRRPVALKVMRSAAPDRASARRFALEAHVLARLQHPGIAQIYGAGCYDGPAGTQPYLAMELVRGEALTESGSVRLLQPAEKLELVASICDALQHAHQRGVIHRDLKPANILVVQEPGEPTTGAATRRSAAGPGAGLRPKILDFGVARAVDEAADGWTAGTLDGQLVGTLPYMSPEQLGGARADVDTRSDIYAVGVIAYELLAGRLPHDLRGVAPLEAARIVRETDPVRLGALDRRFAGDVETIVGKALERERSRRYQSASELAADIRRHLRHEPLSARRHSTLDHLVRFARRHRAATALLTTTLLLIVAGAAVVGAALAAATRERNEAQRQAAIARAINAFVDEDLLGPATSREPDGAFLSVRDALDRAAAAVDAGRIGQPEVEAAVRATIGRCYRRLGLLDAAEPHLLEARRLHRERLGDDHRESIAALNELTKLYQLQGREEEAIAGFRAVLSAKRRLLGDGDQSTIVAFANLAGTLREADRLDEATPLHERAYALATAHLAQESPYRLQAEVGLAGLYRELGRLEESEALYRGALERALLVHGPDSPHTLRIMNSFALLQAKRGRHEEAETLLLEAIARAEARSGRGHPNTLVYLSNLGDLYLDLGRLDEALPLLEESVAAHDALLGRTHRGTLTTCASLLRLHEARGDAARGAELREELARRWIEREGPGSPEAEALREAAATGPPPGSGADARDGADS